MWEGHDDILGTVTARSWAQGHARPGDGGGGQSWASVSHLWGVSWPLQSSPCHLVCTWLHPPSTWAAPPIPVQLTPPSTAADGDATVGINLWDTQHTAQRSPVSCLESHLLNSACQASPEPSLFPKQKEQQIYHTNMCRCDRCDLYLVDFVFWLFVLIFEILFSFLILKSSSHVSLW